LLKGVSTEASHSRTLFVSLSWSAMAGQGQSTGGQDRVGLRHRKMTPDQEAAIAKFKARTAEICPETGKDDEEKEMTEKQKAELSKELQTLIETCNKKNKLPGITDKAKSAKDKLEDDPYNLDYMLELGIAYLEEDKPERASNVMIRGWKRVSEYEDDKTRQAYLWTLIVASMACHKFRQAHAVFMDTEEPGCSTPEEKDARLEYNQEACKIYSKNDKLQQALKCFNRAVETADGDFDKAFEVFMAVAEFIKEVGALEAAKSALEQLAKTDEDKMKLEEADKIADFKHVLQLHNDPPKGEISLKFILICLFFCFAGWTYLMWWLEQDSLSRLKLSDK